MNQQTFQQLRTAISQLLAAADLVKQSYPPDDIAFQKALSNLEVHKNNLTNVMTVLAGGPGQPLPFEKIAVPNIEAVVRRYHEAISEHIWDREDREQWESQARIEADELCQAAREEILGFINPSVVVTIEGGTYQGAMATFPLSVIIHDIDNLKAEGVDYAERQRIFKALTAGMNPVA